MKRIFEPFFKADPSRHDRSSAGLGLSVTKRLIQAIGGSISIHSEVPGKGTEVEIRLKKSL
ncbi:MAG TPA: ATP-binding protein [Methanospirillum sp.]|uniref:sensor histidine kinase n=1 Tax=Methanospirillum sp. TaxID=45200 RepID=UPI002C92EF9C|nr:ATP-binding protein [Methanospirillum sp.]HOJ95218.1 ATP-binding protein [Methanospirillum sp.]HPP76943.1 ATP-binding protein [Methanospirillum sp.]